MFKSRPKATSFYCRRDNCIVGGCPLGAKLASCPLRLYCQAWRDRAAAPEVHRHPSASALPKIQK